MHILLFSDDLISLLVCGVVLFQKSASNSIKEARIGNAFLDTNCTPT